MSHEVEKMAYVNEVPWHGLGAKLTPGADLDTWKKEAGLDWTGLLAQAQFEESSMIYEFTGRKVLYRSDTKMPLTIVSDKYNVVQPGEILEFFREWVEGLGAFTLETAGSLFHGKKVWALAKANDEFFDLGGDRINRYLLLATSYDLSTPTIAKQESIRVVCNNTLGAALSSRAGQIRISHRTAYSNDAVKQKMALDTQWSQFSATVEKLRQKRMSDDKVRDFFFDIFFPVGASRELASDKSITKKLDAMMAAYRHAPGQDLETARGTAWGALNAVTYFIDHQAKSRTADGRLDKAWFGTGESQKNLAAEALVALAS